MNTKSTEVTAALTAISTQQLAEPGTMAAVVTAIQGLATAHQDLNPFVTDTYNALVAAQKQMDIEGASAITASTDMQNFISSLKDASGSGPGSLAVIAAQLGITTGAIQLYDSNQKTLNDRIAGFGGNEKDTEAAVAAVAKSFGDGNTSLLIFSQTMGDTIIKGVQPLNYQLGLMPDNSDKVASGMKSIADQIAAADFKAAAENFTSIGTSLGTIGSTIGGSAGSIISTFSSIAGAIGNVTKQMGILDTAMADSNTSSGTMIADTVAVGAGWAGVFGILASVIISLNAQSDAAAKASEQAIMVQALGAQWGSLAEITQQLATSINNSYAELLKFDEEATYAGADALNLVDIVKQLGGVGALTSDAMTRLGESISAGLDVAKIGGPLAAQAIQNIDTVLVDMGKNAADAQGLVSNLFLQMVDQANKAGVVLPGVAAMLTQFGSDAITGFNQVVGSMTPAIAGFDTLKKSIDTDKAAVDADAKSVADAQTARSNLAATGTATAAQLAAADKTVQDAMVKSEADQKSLTDATTQQGAAATSTKASLENLGVQAVATFANAVAGGMSFSDAIKAADPGLQQLSTSYKDLGITTDNTALQQLMYADTITKNNPTLITAIQGLTGESKALFNMGGLNVDTFQSMEQTGLEMYQKVQSAAADAAAQNGDLGDATRQALLPMQDWLQQAADAAKRLGVPLDANTQQLVDQSRQLGIWQDVGETAAQQQIDSTTNLAKVMQDFSDKLTPVLDKLAGVGTTLSGLPATKNVAVTADTSSATTALEGVGTTIDALPPTKNFDITTDTAGVISDLGNFADKVGAIPDSKNIAVTGDTLDATNKLGGVQTALDDLQNKAITVTVNYVTTGKTPATNPPPSTSGAGASTAAASELSYLPSITVPVVQSLVLPKTGASLASLGGLAGSGVGGGDGAQYFTITVNIDRPIVQDKEAMDDLAHEIGIELMNDLSFVHRVNTT